MADRNFDNRTLFHGDNLDFLRGMNSGSVKAPDITFKPKPVDNQWPRDIQLRIDPKTGDVSCPAGVKVVSSKASKTMRQSPPARRNKSGSFVPIVVNSRMA